MVPACNYFFHIKVLTEKRKEKGHPNDKAPREGIRKFRNIKVSLFNREAISNTICWNLYFDTTKGTPRTTSWKNNN